MTRLTLLDELGQTTTALEQNDQSAGKVQQLEADPVDIYVDGGSFTAPFYNFYLDPRGLEPLNSFNLDTGKTYRFHRLNQTTSHPFYLTQSASNPASFRLEGNGNSTRGITGDEILTLHFETSEESAGNLEYYCTAHPSMQGLFEASSLATEGPQLIKDIREGINSSNPKNLTAFGDRLIFSAEDAYGNAEVWISRGSDRTTTKLKDIHPTKGSNPRLFTTLNQTVYFVANDGINGAELWMSRGNASSTTLVRDIRKGPRSSRPGDLTGFRNKLYFTADSGEGRKIYRTNGRKTKPFLSDLTLHSDSELTVFKNKLFFIAESADDGRALYKWNGRSAKATKVYDSYPDDGRNHSTIDQLTVAGNKLYFTASTYETNTELYVTKGRLRSSRLVKDINTQSGGSNPSNLTAVGKTLYFSADDGQNGRNLWASKGKARNTKLVADIYEGGTANVDFITNVNGTLFFAASSLNDDGNPIYRELWNHDPLTGNSALVKDIHPTSASLRYNNTLVSANGRLLFSADDGSHGLELWKSDGQEDGTTMIEDLFPGRTGSSPSAITVAGDHAYFSAQADQNGRELYAIAINDL